MPRRRRSRRRQAEIAEKTDAEICAEFGLPDPDDMKPGDEVAGFLRKEIPNACAAGPCAGSGRSNPVLACLDGLNDYDDDYTNNATDAPGLKTPTRSGAGCCGMSMRWPRPKKKRAAPET